MSDSDLVTLVTVAVDADGRAEGTRGWRTARTVAHSPCGERVELERGRRDLSVAVNR
jgi:hypothetical protein